MLDWPQHCPSPFAESPGLGDFRGAWDFSARRILNFRESLNRSIPSQIACVAVSGSLARMEAHEDSDLDLLIVVDDRTKSPSSQELTQFYHTVWQLLTNAVSDSPLAPPKPGGVFSSCASWRLMTDEFARGVVDEEITTYGQRMQLLLDAQPIFGDQRFSELQESLLMWFTETRIADQFFEAGPFHWLSQEVRRYWHSIRARACWLFADEPSKSMEVNVKLRSSRLLLIAAFLDSINLSHATKQQEGAIAQMLEFCQQTPLERITSRMADTDVGQFLIDYETAWNFCRSINGDSVPPKLAKALSNIMRILQPLMS